MRDFIECNIHYLSAILFFLIGGAITLHMSTIWPFGFAILLDIFIVIYDFFKYCKMMETGFHEKRSEKEKE